MSFVGRQLYSAARCKLQVSFPPILLPLFMTAPFGAGVNAALPLEGLAKEMTCYFYSSVARLSWQREGGDWLDAVGTAHGEVPYAQQVILKKKATQHIEFDVTDLVNDWSSGAAQAGGIFLRIVEGASSSEVNFLSNDFPDPALRPSLEISWNDKTRSSSAAEGDTYFSCPNHKNYGASAVLKVGSKHNAILVFPFQKNSSKLVTSAILRMNTNKQYVAQSTIGIYSPLLSSAGQVRDGMAADFSVDVGMKSNPNLIFSEDFEGNDWRGTWGSTVSHIGDNVSSFDMANGFEPLSGNAIGVTIRKGVNSGLNIHLRLADYIESEPESAYFRYYLRLGENWNPTVSGGKMPGLSGTYGIAGWGGRKSNGHNGWSARGAFFRRASGSDSLADLRGIGSYVYQAGADGSYGETWGWNLGPTGLLEKGRWYSIEQHVRLNSLGKADGKLEAWVDGKLVFERSNIRYRDVSELNIESVWFNVYHGGVKPAPQDMTLYIDNVVIAREYIGPVSEQK